eukprot:760900-Hanusia_phi.AAC.6
MDQYALSFTRRSNLRTPNFEEVEMRLRVFRHDDSFALASETLHDGKTIAAAQSHGLVSVMVRRPDGQTSEHEQ